jgi:hypothetical protein
MQKRISISVGSFVGALVISFYLYLSVIAGHPLTPAESVRFFGTIAWSTLLHSDEGGARRSFDLTKEVLSHPAAFGEIDVNGHKLSIPLPLYTIARDEGEGVRHYLTFSSAAELDDYFYRVLPASGWRQVEQMGAGHIFEKEDAHLIITQRFYLTAGISKMEMGASRL